MPGSPSAVEAAALGNHISLDPQGVAVCQAIQHHGVTSVKSVRVGKFIELELDGAESEGKLHELCRDLLSNPVIEDYELIVGEPAR